VKDYECDCISSLLLGSDVSVLEGKLSNIRSILSLIKVEIISSLLLKSKRAEAIYLLSEMENIPITEAFKRIENFKAASGI